MSAFVRGVRLGVDVGRARVGVAACDPDGILASPVATLARDRADEPDRAPSDMVEIGRLAAEYGAIAVVVGLPVTLAGTHGQAADEVGAYARRLATLLAPIEVHLSDERMSTVVATRRLAERGVRGKRRRAVVDQAAAVEILQGWLDSQRRRTR
ncbi:putative pre-16S rRNA nuclease [Pilimelia anulata]|uniref:Putative pre-16S rRNA nuclease n=1 Tax=Pilimelia anulata TaxID=53371 RepID=A0A8J3B609_9ACTN|nr:Holliday junction resolvase RuvX [Pilimelia anulata]GGJ86419.1 putative pre-16S rRNA nuclease [Pilimelia anulata]